jgi:AraC-like DNA-binding protein
LSEDRIPSQHFDSAGLSTEDAAREWQAVVGHVFDVEPANRTAPFAARYDTYHLGDILIGIGRFDATRFSRNARKIENDGLTHYLLQLYTSGGYEGRLGGRDVSVDPGEIVTLDLQREIETVSAASSNITVLIPRELLGGQTAPHGHHRGGEQSALVCGLLADHLEALARRIDRAPLAAAPHIVDATLSLYRASLTPSTETIDAATGPLRSALVQRARRIIDRRLAAGDIVPEQLAAELGVSRSTLYRLFEPHDGVAAYVLERRLTKARAALCNPRDLRRVAAIAQDCGFHDQSGFSRTFRRRFGMTPMEMRRQRAPFPAAPTDGVDLRSWIDQLN